MARCFAASFVSVPALGCTTIFGIAAPVTLTTNANGVVTAARIDTAPLASIPAGKIGQDQADEDGGCGGDGDGYGD